MTLNTLASPICSIDVYPLEGGNFSIQADSGHLLAVQTSKNIREEVGHFSIKLAPGGPAGANRGPSWTEIITPMSMVLIGMRRGTRVGIVMIGVVTSIEETQSWTTGGQTQRDTTIVGQDFGYFFSQFGYYSLWYLGSKGGAAGSDIGQPSAGLALAAGAILQGSPADVARSWYENVMAGANGIMADTFVTYKGTRVKFPLAMATLFQQFANYVIPFADSFIATEGSWINKFRSIFPFPWYEFFIATADPKLYGADGGYAFSMSSIAGVTASPVLVARINPVPSITGLGSGDLATFTQMNSSAWNALPLHTLDSGFISSAVTFSQEAVKNFFTINPTWFRALYGQNNANMANFPVYFSSAADVGSIHRYGFKPADGTLSWLSDPNGTQAQTGAQTGTNDVSQDMIAELTARLASWWEPNALMLTGHVDMPLRPDILPGNKFQYQPFKDNVDHDFYIEGVSHTFVFGDNRQRTRTSLMLSRGLPTKVYDDPALLLDVHTGQAVRVNGDIQSGTINGDPGLQSLNINSFTSFLGELARIYQTPQAK